MIIIIIVFIVFFIWGYAAINGAFPLDAQKLQGKHEKGVITKIDKVDFVRPYFGAVPPDIIGVYKIHIDTKHGIITRFVDAKLLSNVPQIGDRIEGHIYLTKFRYEKQYYPFQPQKLSKYPDYSYAWIDAFTEAKNR